jgi:hypothetical protein
MKPPSIPPWFEVVVWEAEVDDELGPNTVCEKADNEPDPNAVCKKVDCEALAIAIVGAPVTSGLSERHKMVFGQSQSVSHLPRPLLP